MQSDPPSLNQNGDVQQDWSNMSMIRGDILLCMWSQLAKINNEQTRPNTATIRWLQHQRERSEWNHRAEQ